MTIINNKQNDPYIPSTLIRFYSLRTDYESKMNSLKNQELYFYNPSQCNDPFEMCVFNNLNIECSNIEMPQKKLLTKLANDVKDYYYNKMLMCCFSGSTIHNIPMWYFYADNYEGLCCEYDIIDKNKFINIFLRKVEYVETCPINDICTFAYEYVQSKDSKQSAFNHLETCLQLASYKSNKWNFECEYRLFSPKKENNVKLKDANLKLKSIYIGFKMCDKKKNEIIEICNKLSVPVKLVKPSKVPFNVEIIELPRY